MYPNLDGSLLCIKISKNPFRIFILDVKIYWVSLASPWIFLTVITLIEYSIKFLVAPLDENEYSPCEEQADSLSSQSKSREGSGKFRSFENGNNDFPSLLNVPLGSDGQGSHDSHNDSGYSTRFGYSAGPSPSLSGTFLFHHSVNT